MLTPAETTLKQSGEAVASNTLDHPVTFTAMHLLTEPERRNAVYRINVDGLFADAGKPASANTPSTLILKQVTRSTDPDAANDEWETNRFFNDWIGAEFLSSLGEDDPITPRFYGGDLSAGFFLLEDFGEHHSLVQPLLEGSAPAAKAALLRYCTCLGKLHARTAGKVAEFEALYASRRPGFSPYAFELNDRPARIARIFSQIEQLGVPRSPALEAELQAITTALANPGPFHTYIHADPCPDNDFDFGDRICLIDFEAGHFGHALIDAIYPRMIFPTCWCCNRLPAAVVAELEARYRAELIHGVPQAADDTVWETALLHLCGHALLTTFYFHLEYTLEKDGEWGRATPRQRVLARLEAFITSANQFRRLPALRAVSEQLLEILQRRWAGTPALALYPAFSNSSDQ